MVDELLTNGQTINLDLHCQQLERLKAAIDHKRRYGSKLAPESSLFCQFSECCKNNLKRDL